MCASCVWGWDATGGTLFVASGASPFSLLSSNSHCALVEEGRKVVGMAYLRSSPPGLAPANQGRFESPRPVSCDHRAASFASAMAIMTSSRLPLALMSVFSKWRSRWRSPARSSQDGLPGRRMIAFRSSAKRSARFLHVASSLACAGPCFRQEPAGIGPASRPCVEIVFVAWGCERIEHVGLHGCKAGWRGGSCRRADAVCPGPILPGPCCRAHISGVVGKHAKRRDAFPQYGGLVGSCGNGPRKAQRRKFPEARLAGATSFRTPAPDTGRCSTYPGSAPPGSGKAWRRPGRPLHLPTGPRSHDWCRWRSR